MAAPRLLPGLAEPLRRLVVALLAMEFLVWLGGGAIVPLLPIYLHQQGSSPALVGVVMGSFFAAGMLTQYPLGRLVDRIGPRPVVIGGLALFAAGCVGFALVPGAVAGIAFRALQGTGAGSVTVANAATIGFALPARERGAAFGALYASQTMALAIGPLVGSIVGASSMRALFFGAALVALGAIVPAAISLPRRAAAEGGAARALRTRPFASRGLLGAALVFVAIGLLGGLYESCWSLLLHLRGASSFEIGLSWTLYCLPFASLSVGAGRLADRVDRRALAAGGICCSAVFAFIYPALNSVVALLALGSLEAVGAVIVTPAALSVLSTSVGVHEQGGAQGFVGSARTGATALGAAGCGVLFATAVHLPFQVVGVSLLLLAGSVLVLWRGLPGRVTEEAGAILLDGATPPGMGS